MIVEDRSKVKAVHFKYPEMMNENAQEEIKNDYNELLSLEEELYNAREVVRELEKKLAEKKKKFDEKEFNAVYCNDFINNMADIEDDL